MGELVNSIAGLRKKLEEAARQSVLELSEVIESKYTDMYNETVEDFYGSYSPLFYDRTWSLYNILKIDYNEHRMLIDFDTDQLQHSSLDNTVFLLGYHGGAMHNGGYYWRTPHPYYTRWGRMAERTNSPYYDIEEKMREYESSEIYDDFEEIFSRNFNS